MNQYDQIYASLKRHDEKRIKARRIGDYIIGFCAGIVICQLIRMLL
jgi:hypothetical protein